MILTIALLACQAPAGATDDTVDEIVPEDSAAEPDDTDVPWMHDHPLGGPVPAFVMVDLNPTSATYGQEISSATLAGRPYGIIFLASQCNTVQAIADDLWAEYAAHPGLWDAFPTYAIEPWWAYARAPEGVPAVTDGNALPYLLDTESADLWQAYDALNHDFFGVTADGTLDAWLAPYEWPADSAALFTYIEAHGPPS